MSLLPDYFLLCIGESGAGKSFLLNGLFPKKPKAFTESASAIRNDTYKTECETEQLSEHADNKLHVIEIPPFNEFYGRDDYACSTLERVFRHVDYCLPSDSEENPYIFVFVLDLHANPRWTQSRKQMFAEFMELYNTQSRRAKELQIVYSGKERSQNYLADLRRLIREQCPEFEVAFYGISSKATEEEMERLRAYLLSGIE
jgi:ABC-type dipeptide/oligopeptide/nickel transport system ATPase component